MDFQELLKDRRVIIGLIAGAVIIVLFFGGLVFSVKGSSNPNAVKNEKVYKEPLDLLTTDNIGKAIEIQALLAREAITAERKTDGTKSTVYLKEYTMGQRDRALLAIVKSGLMDKNVGLEIFDKGDFTSTKEDKRIRLARAINGELARLIRNLSSVENASVFVSIPEQTMFTAQQKPITATVQVTIPSGEKLDRMEVKAITNLLLGSVTGLESKNITISDTNGNVYSSIIDASDEMLDRIAENDKYMQTKVQSQLDKLIGKGNYVITVSTFLRQAPIEKTSIIYDPDRKASITEQTFSEGLGDETRDTNSSINAVSVYLPNGLPNANANSAQNRNYSRVARETQYGVTKTQVNEYMSPGVIEDISIALTLDQSAIPTNMTLEELKELVARAASPKVSSENVSIAYSDSIEPLLASDRPVSLPKPDESGNPWWIAIVLVVSGLIGGLSFISKKVKASQEQQRVELEMLRNKSHEQERQLRDVNLKAAELIEKQSQLAQGLLEQQRQPQIVQVKQPETDMAETLSEISSDIENQDEEELVEKVKSWIEKP